MDTPSIQECIFCKIVRNEIPSKKEYEDEEVLVFYDIAPKAPIHLLIVPKQHIEEFADLANFEIWTKIAQVARQLIDKFGLKEKGYRLVNNGCRAALVSHLHVHLMGDVSAERDI